MVDTTKDSNRKCEHCEHWDKTKMDNGGLCPCSVTGQMKRYWCRCKQFQWRTEYTAPKALEKLKEIQYIKATQALANKDKEMEKLQKQYEQCKKEREQLYAEMHRCLHIYRGTDQCKPGDKLYYIDYEISGSYYTIVKELDVLDDEVMKSGLYFAVQSPVTNVQGFVRVESVNATRFFTTPELAHEAYEKHKN